MEPLCNHRLVPELWEKWNVVWLCKMLRESWEVARASGGSHHQEEAATNCGEFFLLPPPSPQLDQLCMPKNTKGICVFVFQQGYWLGIVPAAFPFVEACREHRFGSVRLSHWDGAASGAHRTLKGGRRDSYHQRGQPLPWATHMRLHLFWVCRAWVTL